LEEQSHQICFISVASLRASFQDATPLNQLPVATASGDSSCFSGLDASEQLPERRGSRTKRGVRAYSPAWSELSKWNRVSGVE